MPTGLSRTEQLASYATWCNSVEGNTTFYGTPSLATTRSWASAAPEGFRFVFKLPRTITHERRLRDCGEELSSFLSALEPLGERARTLSVQLPASFGPGDLGALVRFLHLAPSSRRWTVDVRHPAFSTGEARRRLEDVLAGHGAEWTSFDTTILFSGPPSTDEERESWAQKPRLPRRMTALSDEPIVRYVGRDDVETTVAGWRPWVEVVVGWLAEGRRPTFFVHTPDNQEEPGLVRRFHDEVRSLVPSLEPLPVPIQAHPETLF